jgi:type III secretory pathway component EscV
MSFNKKELILIAGVLLCMIGLLTWFPLIYSVIIAVGIYVGIKILVGRRQQHITKEIPEGICAECGSKIVSGNCPNCSGNPVEN